MRFEAIKVHGIGPYADLDLDLSAIQGRLVAVTGANGAGKSTLLELLSGALYRQCPTRGSLASLAHERDAFVEARVANGRQYTVRQTVDAMTGKGETLILDEAGVPVTESGKVSEADAWIAEHFLPREVLQSSSISVQGSRGFLDLKRSARMSALLRMLRIEYLEDLAESARRRANDLGREIDIARAQVKKRQGVELEIAGAEQQLTEQIVAADVAQKEAGAAGEALAAARAASKDVERLREIVRRRSALSTRIARVLQEAEDAKERLTNNRQLLERGDEIRAAVAAVQACDAAIAELKAKRQAELDLERDAAAEAKLHQGAADAAAAQMRSHETRHNTITKRLAERAKVLAACDALPGLEELRREALKEVERIEGQVEELRRTRLHAADMRISGLRTGIEMAIDHLDQDQVTATERVLRGALELDDKTALEVSDQREQELAAELRAANAKRAEAQTAFDDARDLARRRPELEQAEHEKAGVERDIAQAVAQVAEHESQASAERTSARCRSEIAATIAREIEGKEAERTGHQAEAKLAERLEAAGARVEELQRTVDRCVAESQEARGELAELPEVTEDQAPDLAAQEAKAQRLAEAAQAAASNVGRWEGILDGFKRDLVQVRAQEAVIAALEADQADWRQIGSDLGRDGLQAYEIDAAIPELNTIANDLLHSCHGSRFTVEIRTDRESADGKGMRDALDVRVLDNRAGQVGDRLAETYSGGEVVIVGEALALALTVLACRRAGIERPTLIRDESGAALDAENGRAYVAMLRRAADAVQADKVLYVSHTPELQDLADARIRISDGRVEVQT
jgi:exonuclease SbcC